MAKRDLHSNAWVSVTLIVIGAVAVIVGFLKPLLSDFDIDLSNLVVVEKKVVDTVFVEVAPAVLFQYHTSPYDPSVAPIQEARQASSPAVQSSAPVSAAADNPDLVRQRAVPVTKNDADPPRRPVSNLTRPELAARAERSIVIPKVENYVERRHYEEWVDDGRNPNYTVFDVGSSGMWQARYNSIGIWTDDGRKIRRNRPVPEIPEIEIPAAPETEFVIQEDVIRMSNPVYNSGGTKLDESSLAQLRRQVIELKSEGEAVRPKPSEPNAEKQQVRQEPERTEPYEKFSVSDLFADVTVKRAQKPFDYRSRTISGFDMVQVEGGRFVMGATDEQSGFASSDESPAHVVTVGSFLMSKYEVTQKQWNELMEENPSRVKGDDYPVESVSYDLVQTYISRLNERTGMKFRLPTEAEWEYAARGGKHSRGYVFSGSDLPEEVLWSKETSKRKLHTVGSLAPNELGLYDMSGNVKEWVQDVYVSYEANIQAGSSFYGNSSLRVLRGGSCISTNLDCRVSTRHVSSPSNLFLYTGFRLVCDL